MCAQAPVLIWGFEVVGTSNERPKAVHFLEALGHVLASNSNQLNLRSPKKVQHVLPDSFVEIV